MAHNTIDETLTHLAVEAWHKMEGNSYSLHELGIITEAKQALLTAIMAEMPEEYEDYYSQSPMRKGHMMGYNEALREVTTKLNKMFKE